LAVLALVLAPLAGSAVLIQPATVDRWHREGVRHGWRRRSRRRGRPRIDSTCRDLIRRLAVENCLWGAPRIHGELLKLGITISERTVSRYLHGRPTTRSQTSRTFLANTFGSQTSISVMFADADDEETFVDASDVALRPAQSIGVSRPSIHGPTVDPARSRRLLTLRISLTQRHSRTGARMSSGRDPPQDLRRNQPRGVFGRPFFDAQRHAFTIGGSVR
jgi:homeodomain-containing protein